MGQSKYSNTEIKIKDAAKFLFLKKGFSATTTREIAKESNINLAVLNYYFTSKRKLFEIIMLETLYDFIRRWLRFIMMKKLLLRRNLN